MPVVSINIGPKRVHLTAYCPDDELGLLACDYVLARAVEFLDGTSEAELRRWLTERDPAIAELFAKLDAGWRLPKTGDFTVDPSNAPSEARIIRHLLRERIEQCAGRPAHELAMDAAGPILAPRHDGSSAAACCTHTDAEQRPTDTAGHLAGCAGTCNCREEVKQNSDERPARTAAKSRARRPEP